MTDELLIYCLGCRCSAPAHSFINKSGKVVKSCLSCRERSKQKYRENCDNRKAYYIAHKVERLLYARKSHDYIIAQKILNYKRNDQIANRPYTEEDYITALWVAERLICCGNKCELCQKELKIAGYEGYDTDQFSVDRINNNLAHLKTNTRITCLHCNLAQKPKLKVVISTGTQTKIERSLSI